MRKRLFIGVVASLIILSFSGTVVSALTIGHVTGNAACFSQQRVMEAMEKLCKEKYHWTLYTADAKGSSSALADQIENYIARGVDVVTVAMADLRACKEAIKTAERAGVPIYAIDSGYVPGIMVDVTSNNYVIGAKMGAYLADRLGHKGKIVSIGMNQHHGVRKRRETLDPVLKENPEIKLLGHFDVRYESFYEDARRAMEDYLTRYGNEIDAVWCGWDDLADAAAKAIMERGFTRKDMFIVGADGHPHAYRHIRNPEDPFVATVAQKFSYFASITLELIDKIEVKGVSPDKVIPKGHRIYVDTPLIDPTNVPPEGKLPWPYPWEK
ncbi:hypothetical protein DRI96_00585 [Candidatus Aerophobetes bacterium]|uniref:Periplasmic binding protein domain-containing protein n=1 Tax=Aerophobetes bacterium TaxID=2030807 RepID=A0A662DLL5_UNCAE|nr:MAG: hypothetical protein DRI96_00585 [Candidatus Aerophobetes bacterium]